MQKPPSRPQPLLSASPGLIALVAPFASGICLSEKLPLDAKTTLQTALLLLVLICIFHRYKSLHCKFIFYPVLSLLFLLIGHHHVLTHAVLPTDPFHILNQIKETQTLSLYGVLSESSSTDNSSPVPHTMITIKAKALYRDPASRFYPKGMQKTSGLVRLSFDGRLSDELKPGDHLLAKAKVSRIHTFSVPGSFNFKRHLASKAVFIKGWIDSPADIIKINTLKHQGISSAVSMWCSVPQQIRIEIATFLNKTLSQPAKGLYKAILIGDRNDIDPLVVENFINSGCIHVLAISGMHMGLLAIIFITGLSWLLKRSTWLLLKVNVRKVSVLVSLIPLTSYAFIAGLNLPVLRALLMTTIFTAAIMLDRPGNLLNHILAAALLILAWNPAAVFSASFQLSFSAVTAIATVYPLLISFFFQPPINTPKHAPKNTADNDRIRQRAAVKTLQWIIAGLVVTAAAMVGTLPLVLFHFNRVSLVSPLSNLLVEPLICLWSLVIGIVACLFIPISPLIAGLLFKTGASGLIAAERICAYFSALPYASIRLPTPSPPEILLFYVFILGTVMFFYLTDAPRRVSFVVASLAFFSLLAVTAILEIGIRTAPGTTVTVLDVGHGSSALVQLPYGKNILIDGGGSGNENFDIGERVIAPFLWNKRLQNLDAIIITHPHADHYNGLPFILKHFKPKKLWINGLMIDDPLYRQLLTLARSLQIDIKVPGEGEILGHSGSAKLLCIDNGFLSAPANHPDTNDASLVLRLDTPTLSFLFPADISSEKSTSLVAEGKNLHADILLAPHHGSRSSMNQQFIKTVAPKYIAISVGRNNPYGLPDKSFRSPADSSITVLSTGRDGTLIFKEENGEMTMGRYQIN